jgi:hypothetical protein
VVVVVAVGALGSESVMGATPEIGGEEMEATSLSRECEVKFGFSDFQPLDLEK